MNEIKVDEDVLKVVMSMAFACGLYVSVYYLGSAPQKVVLRRPFPSEKTLTFALETGEKKELAPGESPV